MTTKHDIARFFCGQVRIPVASRAQEGQKFLDLVFEAIWQTLANFGTDRIREAANEPKKGDLAVCSRGYLGLITSEGPEEVSYPDGTRGQAWTGIHLTWYRGLEYQHTNPGDPWSSRTPTVVGYINDEGKVSTHEVTKRLRETLERKHEPCSNTSPSPSES